MRIAALHGLVELGGNDLQLVEAPALCPFSQIELEEFGKSVLVVGPAVDRGQRPPIPMC